MAKKNVAVHIPLQMGFGFEVLDSEGQAPAFLWELDDVYAALDVIQQAQWVSTDVETTGLTDASTPVPLAPIDIKQGASNVVRMRTIQARVPMIRGRRGERQNFVFDCDKMGPKLTEEVARTILSRRMLIAHNAGFDLYWLRLADGRKTMPAMVCDTMLLTRLLRPTLVLKRAELVKDIKHINEVAFADEVGQAAWKSLISGASGGSLADVVLAMFGVVVDKTYQKPNNWTGLLGFGHYDYANDDTVWADRILCELLDVDEEGDLLQAYLGRRARQATVRLIEPQVPELVMLRENGMPINTDVGRRYVIRKRAELSKKVSELIELEPTLEAHRDVLADPDAGLDEGLKKCLAAAFEARGVVLRRTAATGAAQVGEKDLRACKAVQIEASRPLFNAWVAVCRAKKSSAMALEVVGFSVRSRDGRVRSLLSHGPVTGRLSASEPNVQQFPRDQLFRAMLISGTRPGHEYMRVWATELNKSLLEAVAERPVIVGEHVCVESAWMAAMFWSDKKVPDWPKDEKKALEALIDEQFTHKIVASDFGALDVRVGAALCVRSQREMLALARGIPVPGPVQPPEAVEKVVRKVVPLLDAKDPAAVLENQAWLYEKDVLRLETRLEKLKDDLDAERIQRKVYFQRRAELKEELLSVKLGWRLAQCLSLGAKRGEREYSALRDAFVADIDIHTFTGMKLVGRDPMAEFAGLSVPDRKALEKTLKKELGPRRQQGKIANLSLLYGMADAGFQEAAARGYDEHWTMEEAHDIRALWMNAYPEVELWHLWTECLQAGVVYVPEQGREKPVRTGWWMARTLAGRDIVATGLNAALSYQDQSSGADILGLIMHRLHDEFPHIFECGINQVHDELVLCWEAERHDEYLPIVEQVMVECANSLTMPYGVPTAVSPACGPIWVKD
ncbi:DNA polymerase [Burkholderia ubonensis]|nr:DNA polymerase [Burkholderia ubonensis]